MEIYKLKFTRLQNEILRLLCINVGRQLNKRKISKILNVSPTAVAKALPLLEKEKLITLDNSQEINLTSVELNDDKEKAIEYKRIENLKMIYESGLVRFLGDNFPGSVIILFGSYSYGEDTIRSDIDIAIIGYKEKQVNLDKFDKILEREIRIKSFINCSRCFS